MDGIEQVIMQLFELEMAEYHGYLPFLTLWAYNKSDVKNYTAAIFMQKITWPNWNADTWNLDEKNETISFGTLGL